jgi:hypothetical protein
VIGHSGAVASQSSDDLVRFLIELEQPFDPERDVSVAPDQLVRCALTIRTSDYWPNKAFDWLVFGCPIEPVEGDLRQLVNDRSRGQPLRHRALEILNGSK